MSSDTGTQSVLTSHTGRHLVQYVVGDEDRVRCPDCGRDVTATKGTHPLPERCEPDRAHGWYCDVCENALPSHATDETAPMYNDRMAGFYATFRDGSQRWIPVPKNDLDGDPA